MQPLFLCKLQKPKRPDLNQCHWLRKGKSSHNGRLTQAFFKLQANLFTKLKKKKDWHACVVVVVVGVVLFGHVVNQKNAKVLEHFEDPNSFGPSNRSRVHEFLDEVVVVKHKTVRAKSPNDYLQTKGNFAILSSSNHLQHILDNNKVIKYDQVPWHQVALSTTFQVHTSLSLPFQRFKVSRVNLPSIFFNSWWTRTFQWCCDDRFQPLWRWGSPSCPKATNSVI